MRAPLLERVMHARIDGRGGIRTLPIVEILLEIFPTDSLFFCLDDEALSCLAWMHLVHNLGLPAPTDG